MFVFESILTVKSIISNMRSLVVVEVDLITKQNLKILHPVLLQRSFAIENSKCDNQTKELIFLPCKSLH